MSKTGKKRQYIYLAGNISEDSRTYEWRAKFTELVAEMNVVVLDPCKNIFNQKLRRFKRGDNFLSAAIERSQQILRPKDYQLIRISSVVVGNLGLVSPDKPMIGTVQEYTWAHDIFYIPIISITMGETNIYTQHPWMVECSSAMVDTVEEAVEILETFFVDY